MTAEPGVNPEGLTIVCAPDSFKESLTAAEAAMAMARGIARAMPTARAVRCPMADGGEGTAQALVDALGGQLVDVDCLDPLGRSTIGHLGWVAADRLAVCEVAEAVGLAKVPPGQRDPLRATSRGVGRLLRHALELGAREIIIGLGGSATNDAGAGMLTELGATFRDAAGTVLNPTPLGLLEAASVDLSKLDPRLARTRLTIASDVTNPLLGPHGASAIFGPQKGAGPEQVPVLDQALRRWADTVETSIGRPIRDVPGSGAAGGLGAALLALDATMQPGVELIIDRVGLDAAIDAADYVFTGEGSIDSQTHLGKTPWGVANAARSHHVPVVMFAGRVSPEGHALVDDTVVAVIPITPGPCTREDALADAAANLERATATATALLTCPPPSTAGH